MTYPQFQADPTVESGFDIAIVKIEGIPGNSELFNECDKVATYIYPWKGEQREWEEGGVGGIGRYGRGGLVSGVSGGGDEIGEGNERDLERMDGSSSGPNLFLCPSSPLLSFSSSPSVDSPSPPVSLTQNINQNFSDTNILILPKPINGNSITLVSFSKLFLDQFYVDGKINDTRSSGVSENGKLLTYSLHTSEGQSGSPIFLTEGGTRYLIGVHCGRQTLDQYGIATLITDEIHQWILDICQV